MIAGQRSRSQDSVSLPRWPDAALKAVLDGCMTESLNLAAESTQ